MMMTVVLMLKECKDHIYEEECFNDLDGMQISLVCFFFMVVSETGEKTIKQGRTDVKQDHETVVDDVDVICLVENKIVWEVKLLMIVVMMLTLSMFKFISITFIMIMCKLL